MKYTDRSYEDVSTGDLRKATLNGYLRSAVEYGEASEVRSWIEQGAEVIPQGNDLAMQGMIPLLHLAACRGRPSVIEILVGLEPRCIEETDDFGRNALHVAALEGHADATHVLVQMGIDPYQEDGFEGDGREQHFTPAELAMARGHDAVLEAMEGGGVQIDLVEDMDGLHARVAEVYPESDRSFARKIRDELPLGLDLPSGILIR